VCGERGGSAKYNRRSLDHMLMAQQTELAALGAAKRGLDRCKQHRVMDAGHDFNSTLFVCFAKRSP
jgi:hypothetical protein